MADEIAVPPVVTTTPDAQKPVVIPPVATEAAVVPSAAPGVPVAPLDWAGRRAAVAKGDAKLEARLARYPTEEAALQALIEAQNKISSAGLKQALPDKATPEQVDAWRRDNGIPATPNDYEVYLPADVELDADGHRMVDAFLKVAHDANMAPAHVNKALEFMLESELAESKATMAKDAEYAEIAHGQLRQSMGSEFDTNINMLGNLLDMAPAGLKQHLLTARLEDGSVFGNNPEVITWLVGIARELNPMATLSPSGGMTTLTGMDNEMADIQAKMGDANSEYWKGPKSASLQKRFLDLATAQGKVKR